MALDGIVVRAIVHELQACVGGRIGKIHQPSAHDILLHIRSHGNNYKLLLSANPTYPRVHLTEAPFTNPMEAPMFCMLMRKYCENGTIESITQDDLERVIRIQIKHRNELGDLSSKTILVELMGRHSNIILLDSAAEVILDGIHHVTPAISSYRVVLPGSKYTAPPAQNKANPLRENEASFRLNMERMEASGEKQTDKPEQLLVRSYSGLSPLLAKEIVYRAGGRLDSESLWAEFHSLMRSFKKNEYEPSIVTEDSSGKLFFSATRLTHIQGERQTFSSISQCLESFYGSKAERDNVRQRASDLLRFLQNEKTKNVKKLDKLRETLEEAKEADRYRILGELLTASMHLFQKGDKKVEVVNYYDEEQGTVTIELDPMLTPSENAQKYFRRYTKMKNSLTVVQEQIAGTREEIRYLDSLLQQLDNAGLSDIDEIREELMEQGYIRDRARKARKKKKNGKPVLTSFLSSEGVPIYVGKNNTQNEYLTNRLAHSSDTWLHTKDIPGSHVVIRGQSFGEATLHEAAMLAAYYSQARESSQVPVDYTLIRHVRKPNGAKPGFVIYEQQKTLFVTPDEALIKQLPSGQQP
ncbi:Fibronectin-binding protein A N-terminus (FbpA) [Chlamydia abortus]|uniref:Rqc2 family fibronectin-binding protein n=1 Tax=Paenibacillus sp. 32O-W TaxID=1695218 RepID=UPI000A27AB8C|nr:NFACT RNA binding domain-containing protein [Paenibacillus sp. 32O-W]SHE11620.1 Fibronectin-binding protein A N-terminus (FbpA) [Chlamydia abortus]